MRRNVSCFRHDERGAVLVLFAIILPVLIAAAALLADFGGIFAGGISRPGPSQELFAMQVAADAASRSAAVYKVMKGSTDSMVINEARAVAAANNYGSSTPGVTVTVNVYPNISMGYYKTATSNAVEVIIEKTHNVLFLSNFFGWATLPLKARSVAAWNFAPCLVALNNTSKPPTGLTFSGNNTVVIAECGIYSNDPDPASAITANGTCGGAGPTISTYYAGMVGGSTGQNVTGICGINGQAPNIASGAAVVNDPFTEITDLVLPVPSTTPFKPSDFGGSSNNWSTITQHLRPGVYDTTVTPPDGAVMDPGVYYFTGKNGGLTLTGGTLNAPYTENELATTAPSAGVTLVFDSASKGISVSGSSSKLNLTAPPSGDTSGMAIMDYTNGAVSFGSATTALNITGVIYAPYADVTYNSPLQGAASCLTIVAYALKIAGGGTMGGACPAKMMNASGFRAAGLVE